MVTFFGRIPWLVMTLLSMLLFFVSAMYWSFRPDINFLLTKGALVYNTTWRTVFYIHILGGMLAILTGPMQFLSSFRQNYMNLHRMLGKTYVVAIVLLGAPSGLYMAFFASGGIWSTYGFTIMSFLWFYTTWQGFTTIRNGEVEKHKRWMMRSYALTFSAVTLRLLTPTLAIYSSLNEQQIYITAAWSSWAINLVFIESYLRISLFTQKKTNS